MVVRADARFRAEASEIQKKDICTQPRSPGEASENQKKDIATQPRSRGEASEIQKKDITTAHASTVDLRVAANDC
jgi:hypothetical protein